MLRASVRGLLAHKVRLLLTAVAVVLGVAFVTGSLVFTDTLQRTFNDLFRQTTSDVVITPHQAITSEQATADGSSTLPASLLRTVEGVDGVLRARGAVLVNGVQVVGKDGKALPTQGAPAFGSTWSDDPDLSPYRLVDGRGPLRAGEVAVDSQTAGKAGLRVGGTVELTTPTTTQHDTVVGIFRFGTTGNLAGASITAFDTRTAQQVLLGGADAYTAIRVKAAPGVSQAELRDRIASALGPQAATLKIQTGQESADEQAKRITDGLQFFNVFLLVFAGIALVVGCFIILNTFSMLVAQRTRELALLRAIGATRSQVTRSVLFEALAVGLVGSTVGLAVGIGLSVGLRGLFAALGIDLPAGPLVVTAGTVVAAYAVGVLVTLVAAYLPARRAARVPPVAALRVDATPSSRTLRARTIVGVVLLAVGLLALLAGVRGHGDAAPSRVGLGGLLVLVATVVLSPAMSRRVIGVIAAPLARWGTTGRIAVDNARRNPRRTASTASALMIGLALVSAIGVLGASTTASTDAVIDNVVRADFIATNSSFLPLSPDVAATLAATPGVGAVSRVQVVPVQVHGSVTEMSVVDPSTITQMLDVQMVSGSLAGLGLDDLLVDDKTSTSEHLTIGSTVAATFVSGPRTLIVQGVYKSSGAFSGGVLAKATAEQVGARDLDQAVYVKVAPGADLTATRAAVDRAMQGFPNVTVQDQTQFKQSIRQQINQLLYVVYALLALAVVIAVLGIVNTLALSVVERTREIGLLRALGMDRRQLRRTVRLESISIAAYGTFLGVVVGVLFGVALQRSLVDQGITVLGIPWAVLVTVVVLSVVVGVLAAVWPARRAARLDVLQAITTE
jgi:putative ABC transport system permease protein